MFFDNLTHKECLGCVTNLENAHSPTCATPRLQLNLALYSNVEARRKPSLLIAWKQHIGVVR